MPGVDLSHEAAAFWAKSCQTGSPIRKRGGWKSEALEAFPGMKVGACRFLSRNSQEDQILGSAPICNLHFSFCNLQFPPGVSGSPNRAVFPGRGRTLTPDYSLPFDEGRPHRLRRTALGGIYLVQDRCSL